MGVKYSSPLSVALLRDSQKGILGEDVLQMGVVDLLELIASATNELDGSGSPIHALTIVDLDKNPPPRPDLVARVASEIKWRLPLTVGISRTTPDPVYEKLLEAMTFVVVGEDMGRVETVVARDVDETVAVLERAVSATPLAAIAFAQVLRQTARLGVWQGLVAESATYSMLQSGPEFVTWLSRTECLPPINKADQVVRIWREGMSLRVRLDHPERRNAFGRQMRDELVAALDIAIADPAIERVLLSGQGPHFCSGGDLSEFGTSSDVVTAHLVRLVRNAGWRIHRLGSRVSVRVQGSCIGAGVEIPAFASHVVSGSNASFRLPEVSMGLVPGAGGCVSITRRIGRWRTAWLGLSGIELDAFTALHWGLIDELENDRSRDS